MMDERALTALAYVVATIRRDWDYSTIADILRESKRTDYAAIADDAIDAARNPKLSSARVLKTHRRPATAAAQPAPPRPETCPACSRLILGDHECEPPANGCPDHVRGSIKWGAR